MTENVKVIDKTEWNYTVVDNQLIETDQLDIYEKMLYITLKRFANLQTGEAFPGVKKVADFSKMSERKARDVISSLQEKGFIHVEHRKNQTSIYTLYSTPVQYAGGAGDAGGHAHGAGLGVHVVQDPPAQGADELKKLNYKQELKKDNNKIGDSANAVSFSTDEQFEEWWNSYGYKVGDKKKCRTKYKSLLKKNTHEKIMSGTGEYKNHLRSLKANGKFVPNQKYPLTFLNGENFNDDYTAGRSDLRGVNSGRNRPVVETYADGLNF